MEIKVELTGENFDWDSINNSISEKLNNLELFDIPELESSIREKTDAYTEQKLDKGHYLDDLIHETVVSCLKEKIATVVDNVLDEIGRESLEELSRELMPRILTAILFSTAEDTIRTHRTAIFSEVETLIGKHIIE